MITTGDIEQVFGKVKRVVGHARVPRIGWEMDNHVALVELKNGSLKLVGTNHGSPCEISVKQLSAEKQACFEAVVEMNALLRTVEAAKETAKARKKK